MQKGKPEKLKESAKERECCRVVVLLRRLNGRNQKIDLQEQVSVVLVHLLPFIG
jgi:hypothetical protein